MWIPFGGSRFVGGDVVATWASGAEQAGPQDQDLLWEAVAVVAPGLAVPGLARGIGSGLASGGWGADHPAVAAGCYLHLTDSRRRITIWIGWG